MPASARGGDALAPRDRDVQRQQDDRRRVDGHRRRHLVERDAVEQRRHVLDRVDGDADAADFAGGQRVVGVVAHLRRQIEGDAQAADALVEQIPVARVGFRGGAEAGVLPHRPQPAAVHRRLDAARERKLAREAEAGWRRPSPRDPPAPCGCSRGDCNATHGTDAGRAVTALTATMALGLHCNLPARFSDNEMHTSGAQSLSTSLGVGRLRLGSAPEPGPAA